MGFTDGRRLILDVKMEKGHTFDMDKKNFNCALQSYFCEKIACIDAFSIFYSRSGKGKESNNSVAN